METADRSHTQIRVRTILTPQAAVRISDTGGPGFPLLMLHGLSCSRIVFAHQLASPELRRAARILTIDLPGHGDSQNAPDPATAYTISGMADCVASALRQLRIERAAVYGWSLGGHVAIEPHGADIHGRRPDADRCTAHTARSDRRAAWLPRLHRHAACHEGSVLRAGCRTLCGAVLWLRSPTRHSSPRFEGRMGARAPSSPAA